MKFAWVGSPWSLVGPCVFNAFMAVITLGVYSFWGRTEIRRRLWSCIRLDGEPLVYHGTGGELFRGFLAALLVVLLPLFLLGTALVIAYGQTSANWAIYQGALLLVVYPVLKALATYRARRYRLGRTSWRGVRGSVAGSSGEFAFLSWATSFLYPLTLGWIAPWRALYIQRFLIGDTMLGNRPLQMAGSTPSLYLRFGLLWVGSVALCFAVFYAVGAILGPNLRPVMAPADWSRIARGQWLQLAAIVAGALFVWSLISAFYRSSLYNMTANATTMLPPTDAPETPPLGFRLRTRGPQLLWLFLTNLLITYGSLFILRPVAMARSMRYFVRHLSIVGQVTPDAIHGNAQPLQAEGEGLAQAFDFDAF